MPIARMERPWNLVGELKVKKLERAFGMDFPKDYTDFLVQQNGGALKPEHSYTMSFNGRPMIGGLRILYGIEAESWGDIYDNIETFHVHERRMPEFLLPIGCDSGDNQICINLDKKMFGEILHWDMESEIEYDNDKKRWAKDPLSNCHFIAKSFSEFLDMLKPD